MAEAGRAERRKAMEIRLGWDGRWKMADGAGRAESGKARETHTPLIVMRVDS
jgi:hypothetical protein